MSDIGDLGANLEVRAIKMDFVVGLPMSKKQLDSIWVIVDRITKFAQFVLVKSNYTTEDYARIYIDEIVRWHGISFSIILDREVQFTSHLWISLQKDLRNTCKAQYCFPSSDR